MIKDIKKFYEFEDQLIRKGCLTYSQSLALFEGMWREAILLGIFPPKDPMEGIEVDIQIAKIVHSCLKSC